MNASMRVVLENSTGDEARAVLGELQRIERARLTPDEQSRALAALKFGLQNYRDDQRQWHQAQLDKIRSRYERNAERRAPAESVRLQRLRARIDAMGDDEVRQRARDLLDAESPDGDEVDMLSGRLRALNEEPLRQELRTVATERRAWSPWAQDDDGAEHADAIQDLARRDVHTVVIDYEGERLRAPIADLLDIDGALEKETPA